MEMAKITNSESRSTKCKQKIT